MGPNAFVLVTRDLRTRSIVRIGARVPTGESARARELDARPFQVPSSFDTVVERVSGDHDCGSAHDSHASCGIVYTTIDRPNRGDYGNETFDAREFGRATRRYFRWGQAPERSAVELLRALQHSGIPRPL